MNLLSVLFMLVVFKIETITHDETLDDGTFHWCGYEKAALTKR